MKIGQFGKERCVNKIKVAGRAHNAASHKAAFISHLTLCTRIIVGKERPLPLKAPV